MKYPDLKSGQTEAMINILGGWDNFLAVLRGDLTVELKEAIKLLFDKNGRVIPRNLKSAVCDPHPGFYLEKHEVYVPRDVIANWETAFEQKFPISEDEFLNRFQKIQKPIEENSLLANCLGGAWAVTLIPKTEISDYGSVLETVFLPAAERGYKNACPNRAFVNYRKGTLENHVKVISGTRHSKLLEAMAKDNVVIVNFINPTQGFSVHAQREVMQYLPENFTLDGPISRLVVTATYPTIIARDYNTPGLDCSAVSWESADESLYLTFILVEFMSS